MSINDIYEEGESSDDCAQRWASRCLAAEVRVKELDKVHAAAGRHLEAMGPCDDTGDHDDESHCEEFGCTYCNLDRMASAVDEKDDDPGE